MHELYELKEKLVKELEEYGGQEMSTGSLEVIDKLAHAIKNICKIIEAYEMEDEYSQRGDGQGGGRYAYDNGNQGGNRYSRDGGSYRGGRYSRTGGSYARGRGQNARRDSMGRYSRAGNTDEMVEQLEDLMQDAPNEQIKQQVQQLIQQIEQM